MKHCVIASTALLTVSPALAQQVVIDGTAEAAYGNAIFEQAIGTGFGNATDGFRGGPCNGSELDGAFGIIDTAGGYLYVVLAGNLETNFNKLDVFVDCAPGGQNAVRSDNPDVDFNGLNRMGADTVNNLPGLKFDAGFEADGYLTCTIGGTPSTLYASVAQMLSAGGGTGGYLGSSVADPTTGATLIDNPALGVQVSMDNSNVGGVDGSNGGASSGAGVRTGIEMRIPLALLGYTGGPIKVCAFINGNGHDYASNQFLGGLPLGSQNLGGDGAGGYFGGFPAALRFDLEQIPGDQFFTIGGQAPNPCPTDLDGDQQTGGADLGILLGAWGACGATCATDLDGDGLTGGSDLGTLLGAWGLCP